MENEAHGLLSMPGVLVATVGAILILCVAEVQGPVLLAPALPET